MFKLSENIDPNKIFIINHSELEGRFDPIFYASDLAKFNTNIFKSVLLKSIVKYFKSGFGAGKQEQTDAKNGIIQIRPTNIDENGFLKYDKNIYLPIDKNERKNTLKRLERRAKEEKQTQIFIETPFRNEALFQEMLQTLESSTKLCIACDITLSTQYIRTFPISVWKKQTISLHKRPTIFVIGK